MKVPARPAPPVVAIPAPAAPAGTWSVWILLAAILLAASGLRLWNLDSVPPGAWIDEAIQGVQGAAMRDGVRLPPTAVVGYQPMPEWVVPEAVAMRLGGDSLGVIRIPAALAGILAVGLAFLAGRALAGPAAGLGAAAFLMGSFWHVQYSRLALPCVFVVTEGLVIAWLLLGRSAPGLGAGCGLALVCVAALYGYAASLITPVAAGLLLAVRWFGASRERPSRGFMVAMFVCAVGLAAGIVWWRPQGLLRTAELAGENRDPFIGQVLGWLKSVVWSTAPGLYYWRNYPPGAPRFSPVELALVVAGIVALWRSDSLARWQKWGWTAWAAACVAPEVFGGEAPHLSRGLPQLAPAAIAAGVAVGMLTRKSGRWGPVLAIVALAVNAGMTTHRLFVRFAHDPLVATWSLKPNRDAMNGILTAAAREPVALAGAIVYDRDPVRLFFLGGALRRGDIVMTMAPTEKLHPVSVYYDPSSGQPAFVLFDAQKRWQGRRHLCLMDVNQQLLGVPEAALSAGHLQEALVDYRWIAEFLPDAMGVRAGLGLTLFRLGRFREAIPHLEFALACRPEGNMRALLEDALARARQAVPGPLH